MIVVRKRVVKASELGEDIAAVVVGLGVVRLGLERGADQLQRLGAAALLGAQDAEEMARLGMVASDGEDLAIAALSVGKLAALVQRRGLMEQFSEIERL